MRLQQRQRLAHAPGRGVDLVDEQEARNLGFFEFAHDDFKGGNFPLVGLAHDDRRIADGRDVAHFVR